MPPAERKVKRVVSTDFEHKDNPLRSARTEGNMPIPPFLVGIQGICQLGDNCGRDWDVMIVGDKEDPGLGKPVVLTEPIEVLWLYHDQESTLKQEEKLKELLGNDAEFLHIPFHHGRDYYDRYLRKVEMLWKGDGDYADRLAQLDHALRAEQRESDACDILWLLAGYYGGADEHATFDAAKAKIDDLKTGLDASNKEGISAAWKAIATGSRYDHLLLDGLKKALKACLAGSSPMQEDIPPA